MRFKFYCGRRFFSFSKHFKNREFYKTHDSIHNLQETTHVIGEIVDQAIDLKTVRPGDVINIPYEVTISHSLRDFWQSAFYSHDRINTSTPFARFVYSIHFIADNIYY